jgi:hypothetical protein
MEYKLSIMRDGEPVLTIGVTADEVIEAIALALPDALDPDADAVIEHRPRKYKKRGGKRGPHKTEKDLADEVDQRIGRSRLDPAITQDVEDRLIAGESVAAIHEKVDVSAPTIYVIKKRLQKEGRP